MSVFTEEEALKAVNNLNFFFISAIHNGIPIYGTENFQKMKAELQKIVKKHNIQRIETGWKFT